MKFVSYFLGAVLLASVKGQATDCDYDYVCDDRGSPEDLLMAAPTPRACYEACKASTDDGTPAGNPNCQFWTYYEELGFKTYGEDNGTVLDGVDKKTKAFGNPVCRRLTSCNSKFPLSQWCNPSQGKQKCASGPGSCEACDVCDPLVWDDISSNSIAHWSCNVDMPYARTGQMPTNAVCRTQCPSSLWSKDSGATTGSLAAPIKVEAICTPDCTDTPLGPGKWVLTPIDALNGDSLAPTPTKDDACPCDPIVLDANQLPGSTEDGAEMFCTSLVEETPGSTIYNTMDSSTQCQLVCNAHTTMYISCISGFWTEGVESKDDIYCGGPPEVCTYNPGVNANVCTCREIIETSPDIKAVCAAGQGCNNALCYDECVANGATVADCFCATNVGGLVCTAGQTCDSGAGSCA